MSSTAPDLTRRRFGGARRTSPVVLAVSIAVVLGIVWALLPPTGSDLAAQVAHADFFGRDGWLPIDLRWFGGTDVLGYSLLSPPLMALLGVTTVGVLSTVVSCGLLADIAVRCAVHRPRLVALAGALCLVANLVVGRITFALGVAAALATLRSLWVRDRWRLPLLVVGTVATWAASPLAVLFLAMVGAALALRRRVADGAAIAMTGALTLLASSALGQGGVMPMDVNDLVRGVLGCAIVAVVTRYPLVRIVAVLSAVLLVLTFVIPTPVGVNALRFPALFAVPVALATSRLHWRLLTPALAVVALLLPPLTMSDAVGGQPANGREFFAPLNAALRSRPLTGRVEVVPTQDRWEAVYVARRVPLARGWMTQLDKADNALFFDPARMTARHYHRWLRSNAVQYVAVSDAVPATAGTAEKALIDRGLGYLRPVWHNAHWQLLGVRRATQTVSGARLVRQNGRAVVFDAPAAGSVVVRVQWSRWLTLSGPSGCLTAAGRWTQVTVDEPGRYRVSSSLLPDPQLSCARG